MLFNVTVSVDFYRNYSQYVNGFGEVGEEHWLGLELFHPLSTKYTVKLRVGSISKTGDRRNVALFHAIEKCYFMRFVFTYIHYLCD